MHAPPAALVPPQNLEAEESVLGAMLLSETAIGAVTEIIDASDFYRGSHGTIYRAMLALWAKGEPVDAITLANELEERGELEQVGGNSRVAELAALVPAAANADHYAKIVDRFTQQLGLDRYALYVMDYGAPVGFRLPTAHPERVSAIVVQNGNAYDEGITGFWDPIKAYWRTGAAPEREALRWLTSLKATQWQYTDGVRDASLVSPDAWTHDQSRLDRPGNQEIQLDLFYDYRNNLPLYPQWQRYFRERKPPMLVGWGANDQIFVAAGAAPYRRDNPNAQVHMLDTGHFALETHGPQIAKLNVEVAVDFVKDRVTSPKIHDLSEIPAGEGRVVEIEGERVAVYREPSGKVHAVSPVCTHAACIVRWRIG